MRVKCLTWFWTVVWVICMAIILPFVLLTKLGKPFEWLLWLFQPFGMMAGIAYRRMFTEFYAEHQQ